jgi:type I restriction enzyme M protein
MVLGELIDVINNINIGNEAARKKDLLGVVYEYFLGQFALAEGRKGGQFYTPRSVVQLLIDMLQPTKGKVFDPCCGSGGMFVMSEKFVLQHQGRIDDITIYGQESNQTTWRLAVMNLAIRGIDSEQVKWNSEGSFLKDAHPDLKADYIIANPPFNISDYGGESLKDSHLWKYGVPPFGNANYGWLQLVINKLSPSGIAGIVLANGAMTSNSGGENEIRKNMILDGVVDCMVALPTQLFFNTQIPACLWFLARNRTNGKFRNRKEEILFIDARKSGALVTRKNKAFTDEDISKISEVYHRWRSKDGKYEDIQGFCKSATLKEVEENNFVLTPGRYVGTEDVEDDGISYEDKIAVISENLKSHFEQSILLQERIKENLKKVGIAL